MLKRLSQLVRFCSGHLVRKGYVALPLLLLPFTVYGDSEKFTNPLGDVTLCDFLLKVLEALILILFPILALMIVYSGFLFVRAQGNPSKLEEARRVFVYTLIGGLVVLGGKAIALAIGETVTTISGDTITVCK